MAIMLFAMLTTGPSAIARESHDYMNSRKDASRQRWILRNRMVILAVAVMAGYAAFIEWAFGWAVLFREFAAVGYMPLSLALAALVGTYFIRCWRIHDYFPAETSGRFLLLFRVTQVHNLLNIMLPLRTGETSFPLLMRSEFGMPLARATAALLVMRLLDLHALFAAAGIGIVIGAGYRPPAVALWFAFLLSPVAFYAMKRPVFAFLSGRLPEKLRRLVDEVDRGMPVDMLAFVRAWMVTVANWGIKVVVLAWALALMGVEPFAACFGGALGGELSSVLPVHAPGGVGTYPAGITAGAMAFGASSTKEAIENLAQASINAHLLIVVSALTGTAIGLLVSRKRI